MSQCLNPDCLNQNEEGMKYCQECGFKLLLRERYRGIKVIGQGGFGRTSLAVDEGKPSKPYCVIKQFLPLSGNLSDELGNVLDKLVPLSAKKRFQSAREVLEELNSTLKPLSTLQTRLATMILSIPRTFTLLRRPYLLLFSTTVLLAAQAAPIYCLSTPQQANQRWEEGDYEGAIEVYSQAIPLDPNDAGAYYNRGVMLAIS